MADGRRVAVAWKHDSVVGKRVEAAANAGCQGCKIAVGEVGPPDALQKQHVSPEHQPRARVVGAEDNVPTRVARDGDDGEGEAGEFEGFAVVEETIRRRAAQGQPERAGEIASRVGQFRGVVAADQDWQGGPSLPEGRVAGDMVGVAMGEQDRDGGEAMILDPADDSAWLEARVEDQTFRAAAATDHVGVFTKRRRLDAGDHDVGMGGQQFSDGHGKRQRPLDWERTADGRQKPPDRDPGARVPWNVRLLSEWFSPVAGAREWSGPAKNRAEMAWWQPQHAARLAASSRDFVSLRQWRTDAGRCRQRVGSCTQVHGGRDGWIRSNAFGHWVAESLQRRANGRARSCRIGGAGPHPCHRLWCPRPLPAACRGSTHRGPACRWRRRPDRTGPRA